MEVYEIWQCILLLLCIGYGYLLTYRYMIHVHHKRHISKWAVLFIWTLFTYLMQRICSGFIYLWLQIMVVAIVLEVLYIVCKKRWIKYRRLHRSGKLLLSLSIIVVIFNFYQMHKVVKTSYELNSYKIDHLHIIQISDVYIKTSDDVSSITNKIDAARADMVVLDGNIFSKEASREVLVEVMDGLKKTHHPLGMYYILGDSEPYFMHQQGIKNAFLESDIHILEDEITTVKNITIIGRKSIGKKQNQTRLDMETLLRNVDRDNYTIVLDHQPMDLYENAVLGIDLQLSGYTKGGDAYPLESIQAPVSKLPYGMKKIQNFTAITTSGMDTSKKTGAPNEYIDIKIH